jgi:hypothetical protein
MLRSQCLPHLDFAPLVMGAAGATVGIILTPLVAPAALGVVGFGAAGPVAGESHRSLLELSSAHS